MKKMMNRIWMLALLAMASPAVGFAQESGEEPTDQEVPQASVPEVRNIEVIADGLTGGTITKADQAVSESDASLVTVTLTVTPADGYKISKGDIRVGAVIPLTASESSASGTRSPEIKGYLELVGEDPTDPREERTYTVTLEPKFDIWVEKADFQLRVPLNDISADEASSVTWTLSEEGVLSIDGTGSTKDFDASVPETSVPWDASKVKSVVVGDRVTGLGANIFNGCTDLQTIKIKNAERVVALGTDAIPTHEGLTIDVPGNLLNEYQITAPWSGLTIGSEDKVEISGFAFSAQNAYDTFVATQAVVVPSVLKAYTITGIDGSSLVLTPVTTVAAGEPVVVFTEHQDIPTFYTVAASQAEAGPNLLKVAPEGGKAVKIGQVYMLYHDNFYFTRAGTIPEGQVYLEPQSQNGTRSFYSLDGDGTTAIDSQRIGSAEGSSAWYGLDGRRLAAKPTRKGIYVKDGKKVIIR